MVWASEAPDKFVFSSAATAPVFVTPSQIARYSVRFGINSATAADDTNHLTAVGMLVPSSATTFDNQSLGTGDVAIKYTYYGDANLDGRVDGSDYALIDNGFLQSGSLTGWYNGDFNYDGVVDGSDYTLMDNAYNNQGAQLSAAIAGPTEMNDRRPVRIAVVILIFMDRFSL